MQRLLLLLAALALAGCTTPDAGETPDDTNATLPDGTTTALPAPIEDSQTVTGSADPLNFVGEPPCASPSSQCFRYPFTLNSSATIDASLSWDVPANDFDLYVFQEGAPITSTEGASPPGSTGPEAFTLDLDAGDYELVVVAWSVAQDTFTVSATFS